MVGKSVLPRCLRLSAQASPLIQLVSLHAPNRYGVWKVEKLSAPEVGSAAWSDSLSSVF